MDIVQRLTEAIASAAGVALGRVQLEHPAERSHGDYASNIALISAKKTGKNPHELAESLVEKLEKDLPDGVAKVEVAGPGFINFHLADSLFTDTIEEVLNKGEEWGTNNTWHGKRVMVEYTDPNPFKAFHIGHLVPNAVGEAIARMYELSGADVVRADYFGNVGMHVAMALWGMQQTRDEMPGDDASLTEKTAYLGRAYALGARAYREDAAAAQEIKELNKKIYERSDETINELYDKGYGWSMDHFETIFEKLGTKFDVYYPESKVAPIGAALVRDNMDVFDESDGAIIYRGERHGLHTRVFINAEGIPTYETKDLGLAHTKFKEYDLDLSITVTGKEQEDYFRVVKAAISEMQPEIHGKIIIKHNGMLTLSEGKMSSRTGNVITGETILNNAIVLSRAKMDENEYVPEDEKEETALAVAVAAIKYAILKQGIGKDFVFDMEQAFSFEGDSGPYIQYTYARAKSIIAKGANAGLAPRVHEHTTGDVERLIQRFPEVVRSAGEECAPQHLVTYVTELASCFNTYYADHTVVDPEHQEESEYRLALTEAVAITLKNGLWALGIRAPEHM